MSPIFALILQAAAPASCAAVAPPPAGLTLWGTAAAPAAGAIALSRHTALTLQPVDKVAFAPAPGRSPNPGTFGGVYPIAVATAGTYRIALSAGAWIDVVRDGKSLGSVAHTEGPPCSGIRKIVDFALTPGAYTLQLSGAKMASMQALIVAK